MIITIAIDERDLPNLETAAKVRQSEHSAVSRLVCQVVEIAGEKQRREVRVRAFRAKVKRKVKR